MKELSVEDKAKAYDEAFERARNIHKNAIDMGENIRAKQCEIIFPELKVGKDEKIRIAIYNCVSWFGFDSIYFKDVSQKECLSWLEKQSTPQVRTGLEWINTIDDACDKRYSEEYAHGEYCHGQSFKWGFLEGVEWLKKQGEKGTKGNDREIPNSEQKPAWSEEDENLFRCAIDAVKQESKVRTDGCLDEEVGEMVTNWLNAIKERVRLLPKQEWSDYDECMLTNIIDDPHCSIDSEYVHWLKSLKDKYTWKPSELDIRLLERIVNGKCNPQDFQASLCSLIEQLKKLREE